MKNLTFRTTNFLLVLLAAITLTISCKKGFQSEANQDNNSESIDKINKWLNEQKTKVSGDRPLRIESLQKSLLFSRLYFEESILKEKLIIVPISGEFKTENNKEKNPANCLLISLNGDGTIKEGRIVQYIALNSAKTPDFPRGFFNKSYFMSQPRLSGTITYLSISDDLIYETKYEDGNYKSYSKVINKPKASHNEGLKAAAQCYDVWWVTYYYGGGSTWEYLYSFCDDGGGGEEPCFGVFMTNGRTFKVGCGGGSGGSSGSGNNLGTVNVNTTHPCLTAGIYDVLGGMYPNSSSLSNLIDELYTTIYASPQAYGTLNINQVPGPTSHPAETDPSQGAAGIYTISINPDFFNGQTIAGQPINPTREYWASQVIHEIVHTFIDQYNLSSNISQTGLEQHQAMITSWVSSMSSLMQSVYGMSLSDARALSLSGVGDVLQRSGAASNASWDSFIQANYGLSTLDVIFIMKDYMTGDKGRNNCP